MIIAIGNDESNFHQILLLLQETIPREAQKAQRTIAAFQPYSRVQQVDLMIESGHRVRIGLCEAELAREEWELQDAQMRLAGVAAVNPRHGSRSYKVSAAF